MRILFVALPESVHTARWINQLADQGWDIHLFAARYGFPHQALRNVTIHTISFHRPPGLDPSVRIIAPWPWFHGTGVWYQLIRDAKFARRLQVLWLVWVIRWLKPDIVHSLEFQEAGYLALEAQQVLGKRFPPWIVTNWGSDLYLFGRLAVHIPRIKAVLAICDYYSCECHRDVELALEMGLRGEVLPVFPNTGGFDLSCTAGFRQPGPTSLRKLILLKGYQHFAGRALVGLRAIEMCADQLQGYRVAIYLASNEVKIAAELVAHATGLEIDIILPCPHDDMLRLYGRARIYLGLSISDAISTSLLEAMVMGCFPIQSCTACADEWITDGETGFIVPPEDPAVIATALRRAVSDDQLVDNAAERNAVVSQERLSVDTIRPQAVAIYETVVGRKR